MEHNYILGSSVQLPIDGWQGGCLGKWAGRTLDHCQLASTTISEVDLLLVNQKAMCLGKKEQLRLSNCF